MIFCLQSLSHLLQTPDPSCVGIMYSSCGSLDGLIKQISGGEGIKQKQNKNHGEKKQTNKTRMTRRTRVYLSHESMM